MQRPQDPLIATVGDDLDPGVMGGHVDLVSAWKRTPPSSDAGRRGRPGPRLPGNGGRAGYGRPLDIRRRPRPAGRSRPRASGSPRSCVSRRRRRPTSFESSQRIASAPTSPTGSPPAPTNREHRSAMSSGVRFATCLGALERPQPSLDSQVIPAAHFAPLPGTPRSIAIARGLAASRAAPPDDATPLHIRHPYSASLNKSSERPTPAPMSTMCSRLNSQPRKRCACGQR